MTKQALTHLLKYAFVWISFLYMIDGPSQSPLFTHSWK